MEIYVGPTVKEFCKSVYIYLPKSESYDEKSSVFDFRYRLYVHYLSARRKEIKVCH